VTQDEDLESFGSIVSATMATRDDEPGEDADREVDEGEHQPIVRALIANRGFRPPRGVDTSVIALWLGHEQVDTTQIYLHADLALKERALARTMPPNAKPGRYRPSNTILAFLDGL